MQSRGRLRLAAVMLLQPLRQEPPLEVCQDLEQRRVRGQRAAFAPPQATFRGTPGDAPLRPYL
jgi:hypothetical protein